MGNISYVNRVRNGEVLRGVKEDRNILNTIKIRTANWIFHILRRNCLMKRVIKGNMEGRSDGKMRKKIYAATG